MKPQPFFIIFVHMIKLMSAQQYADKIGYTHSGVTKALRQNRKLKGIVSFEKVGKMFMIKVRVDVKGNIITK